jgi:hypothetical protein
LSFSTSPAPEDNFAFQEEHAQSSHGQDQEDVVSTVREMILDFKADNDRKHAEKDKRIDLILDLLRSKESTHVGSTTAKTHRVLKDNGSQTEESDVERSGERGSVPRGSFVSGFIDDTGDNRTAQRYPAMKPLRPKRRIDDEYQESSPERPRQPRSQWTPRRDNRDFAGHSDDGDDEMHHGEREAPMRRSCRREYVDDAPLAANTQFVPPIVLGYPFTNVNKFEDKPKAANSFREWFSDEFEPAMKELNLPEAEQVKRLRSFLGTIGKHAYDLEKDKHGDQRLQPIVSGLNEFFSSGERPTMQTVHERKMRHSESVREYAIELETLYKRVYPMSTVREREHVLAHIFAKGIPSSLLEYSRVHPWPDNLSEFVKKMHYHEGSWRKHQSELNSAAIKAPPTTKPPVRTGEYTRQDDQRRNFNDDWNQRQNYGNRENSRMNYRGNFSDRQTGPPLRRDDRDSQLQCWECGRFGHRKADCFANNHNQRYGRPNNEWYKRRYDQNYRNDRGYGQGQGYNRNYHDRDYRNDRGYGRDQGYGRNYGSNSANHRQEDTRRENRSTKHCSICEQDGHTALDCSKFLALLQNFGRLNARDQTPRSSATQIMSPTQNGLEQLNANAVEYTPRNSQHDENEIANLSQQGSGNSHHEQ